MFTRLTHIISIIFFIAIMIVVIPHWADAQPEPDFVTILEGETVTIDVLANDSGSGTALSSEFIQPQYGTVEKVNGKARYTNTSLPPDGIDTFEYNMLWSESTGVIPEPKFGSATVMVNVENIVPVVQDVFVVTNENIEKEFQIEIDHPTIANAVLTSRIVTPPTNGSVLLLGLDTFMYIPNPGFDGTDSFEFVINDGTEDGNIGTVTIGVVNDFEDITVDEDTDNMVIDLSAYFALAYGNDLVTYSISKLSGTATTESIAGNLLTLEYNPNQHGLVQLQVTASTVSGESESHEFGITINPVDDLPALVTPLPDHTVDEDALATVIDLNEYFADLDTSDPLNYTISSTGPIAVSVSGNQLTITFDENQHGQATVSVTATDSEGKTVNDEFIITINPVNDAPYVVTPLPDISVEENAPATVIDLAPYFADVEGDTLTFSALKSDGNQDAINLELNGNLLTINYLFGKFGVSTIQIIVNDSNGNSISDSFNVTINSNNALDIREGETRKRVYYSKDLTVPHDYYYASTTITKYPDYVTVDNISFNGTNSPNPPRLNGYFVFTSPPNYYGEDSIKLNVKYQGESVDIFGSIFTPTENITINLKIKVHNIPDSPVANAVQVETRKNSTLTFFLDGYDPDNQNGNTPEPVTFSIEPSTFANGTLQLVDASTGEVRYTSTSDFAGTETFTFNVTAGGETVSNTVSISVINYAPEQNQSLPNITVDANTNDISTIDLNNFFTDIDGDILTYSIETLGDNPDTVSTDLSDNILSIAYVLGKYGNAIIRITATDIHGDSISDVFSISVINYPPELIQPLPDITVEENTDEISTVDLSNYYTDINGDTFTYSIEKVGDNPNAIEVDFTDDGISISYIFGLHGNAIIRVTATDIYGNSSSSDINITINSNGKFDMYEGEVQKTFSLSNTGQVQGEIQSKQITNSLETLILDDWNFVKNSSQRYFTVSSPSEFNGDDSFTIKIRSRTGNPLSGYKYYDKVVQVDILVHAVPDTPVANAMQIETPFETGLTFLLDGYDPDNQNGTIVDPVSFSVDTSSLANGTLQLLDANTGEVQYTPNSGFSGTDSLTYTVTGGEETASNTVTITVLNSEPVIVQAFEDFTVDEDAEATHIDLNPYFTDLNNGDFLTFSAGSTGPVSLNLTENLLTVNYNANQFGEVVVDVTASDSYGASVKDSFLITITPVNDTPVLVTPLPDYNGLEDEADHIIDVSPFFTDIDEGDALIFSATRTNGPFQYTLDGSILTVSHNPDQSGQGYITIIATDTSGESVSDDFKLWIQFVNDAPEFQLDRTELVVVNTDGTQTVTDVISGVSPGPNNDSRNQVSFQASTSAPELFTQVPTIDPNGVLVFEPLVGAEGTAEVYITLTDNGGTQNGGVDTSETQTLLIRIEHPVTKLMVIDSNGMGIAGASAQYYADGGWIDVPGATDSTGELELDLLLSGRVKFRMTYEGSNQTITQNMDENRVVRFQTVLTTVELVDSSGSPLTDEAATVEFNRSGWQPFGTTDAGIASREMLPGNYNFRMSYANGSYSISQNIADNPTVTFQTVPVTVSLLDSTDNPINSNSEVLYRGSEWLSMGALDTGSVTKELLPVSYRFRVTHASATVEKRTSVKFEPSINFKTKKVNIELRNSAGELITDGTARIEYSSNGWNDLGVTDAGLISVELLPKTYNFRIEHLNTVKTKSQNIQFNPTVSFKTVKFTMELRNSESNLITSENGSVQYNSGGWNEIGDTDNGAVKIELLPNLYNFRMTYANASADQKNDFFESTVVFQTENIVVELRNSTDELFVDAVGSVEFNSGGWQPMGDLVGGMVTKELLPKVYSFRMNYAHASNDGKNDGDDPLLVTFNTSNVTVQLIDSAGYLLEDDFSVEYNSGGWHPLGTSNTGSVSLELLPKTYNFRLEYNGKSETQKADAILPEALVNFFTGQVVSTSGTAVQVNSGGWIPFVQNMELLSGNYKFKFDDNHHTTYAIEAGFINEIE